MDLNHSIVIPKQWYVGVKREPSVSDVPVAMMVPNGTDAPTKKKIDRVKYWANHRYYNDEKASVLNTFEMDNKPISGFRISKSLRRLGWNNKSMFVRVEDPRGFEVDISVSNLIMIIDNNLLHNGEIAQACVWGRDGTENKLLPVNSIPYVQAVQNTERTGKKISVRNVKKGDEILLHDGRKGTYMGAMYAYLSGGAQEAHLAPKCSEKRRHVVRVENENNTITYLGFAAIKISEVLNANPRSEEELLAIYQNDKNNKSISYQGLTQSYCNRIAALMYSDKITLTSIEYADIEWSDLGSIMAKNRPAIVGTFPDGTKVKLATGQFNTLGEKTNYYSRAQYRYLAASEFMGYKIFNHDYMSKGQFDIGNANERIFNERDCKLEVVTAVYSDENGKEVLRLGL